MNTQTSAFFFCIPVDFIVIRTYLTWNVRLFRCVVVHFSTDLPMRFSKVGCSHPIYLILKVSITLQDSRLFSETRNMTRLGSYASIKFWPFSRVYTAIFNRFLPSC